MDVAPDKQFALGTSPPPHGPVACSRDGLLAVGTQGAVRLGAVDSRELRIFGSFAAGVSHIAFDAAGKRVGICAANLAIVWDVESGRELARYELPDRRDWFEGIHLRSDGKTAYLLTHYGDDLLAWDITSNKVTVVIKLDDCKTLPANPRLYLERKSLAVIGDHTVVVAVRPGFMVYDTRTKAERFVSVSKGLDIVDLAASEDGKSLAVSYVGSDVYVYDSATWQQKSSFRFPAVGENETPSMEECRFTHDGKYLVVAGLTGNVRPSYVGVFEAATGKSVGVFPSHAKRAASVAVTPKDQFLVTAGAEGLRIWDFPKILEHFKKQ